MRVASNYLYIGTPDIGIPNPPDIGTPPDIGITNPPDIGAPAPNGSSPGTII